MLMGFNPVADAAKAVKIIAFAALVSNLIHL